MKKISEPITDKIVMGIDPGTNMMGYGILRIIGSKTEMIAIGVIELNKYKDPYMKLGKIFERITQIIDSYHPDEIAIESPFFGKNVQSMLKLGRAQGVAIAAAIERDVPITEYPPAKIKVAITGNGSASKEQVAGMLQKMLKISDEVMNIQFDATDALAAAYCHFLQIKLAERTGGLATGAKSWREFINQNKDRVFKGGAAKETHC